MTIATPAALAAKKATTVVPIVMATSADPVRGGVVDSLARPGGNVTGLTLMTRDLAAKRLAFLKEAVPGLSRVAAVHDQQAPPPILRDWISENEEAARTLGLTLRVVGLPLDLGQWDEAMRSMAKDGIGALSLLESPTFGSNRKQLGDLALKHRLPTIFPYRLHAESGGLMTYGVDVADLFRRAAVFVDKILRGARPADLPVEQPTKFELVINLKTARALRVTLPPSLLLRADHVIE